MYRGGQDVGGLDDGPRVKARPATIADLQLAGESSSNVNAMVSSLPAFDMIRRSKTSAGLMGNSCLSRFERFEIDFQHWVVRFAK